MIYTFKCECGAGEDVYATIAVGPPKTVRCFRCKKTMQRDWQADAPMLDTSACRDHNKIAQQKRVAQNDGAGMTKGKAERLERAYGRDIAEKRKINEAGKGHGRTKMTHSIPAELYHGKIRETGDNSYWKDKKNVERHKEWSV